MSDINTGGPAFPIASDTIGHWSGMQLRDYMAIHASDADVMAMGETIRERERQQGRPGILPDGWGTVARYMHADAMLRAREGGAA